MKKFLVAFVALCFGIMFSGLDIAHARGFSSGGFRSSSSFSRSYSSFSRPSYTSSWSRPSYRSTYTAPRVINRTTTIYRGSGSSGFGSSFMGSMTGSMLGNALSRPAAPVVVGGGAPVVGGGVAPGMAPIAPGIVDGVPVKAPTNGWDFLNSLLGAILAIAGFGVIGLLLYAMVKRS